MHLPQLPIQESIPQLKAALAQGSAVLAAPPGSGKTTLVPLCLLEESWLGEKKILILEPRRLATRAAAARMASLLGEEIGQRVGYQIRFERRISAATRIEVITEGILTRRIQQDPELSGVGLIIFDEFHERSLHADLALALCLDLGQLRDDLRLLVMSATLDTAPTARLLGGVPVISAEGRSHPVRVDYLQASPRGRINEVTARGIRRMVEEQQGDILAFLPGSGEIRATLEQLRQDPACDDLILAPLFGDLSQKEQDRAILPDPEGRRRVILATSIAETSLTIEGVTTVVDSGWSRRPRFEPATGLTRLVTVRGSRAVARQRAGRAGRLGPGSCLRLWSREEQHSLPPFHPAEIISADLAGLALELALWGISDPGELSWLDPPRSGAYQKARELLHSLGAVNDQGRITAMGKKLAALPLHPRLGYMLLKARAIRQLPLACDLAGLLSERDILRAESRHAGADLQQRLRLLRRFRSEGAQAVSRRGGDPGACRRVDRSSRQWQQLIRGEQEAEDQDAIGRLLVYAFPDRVCGRRPKQRERYLLASGRGAALLPGDPLAGSDYLVAPHLDGGRRGHHGEGRIFLAAPLERAELIANHPELLSSSRQVCWDAAAERVVASQTLKLGALVLEQCPATEVSADEICHAMLEGIRLRDLTCLPWSKELRQFQARVELLRRQLPEQGWPDLSDQALLADLAWLSPYLGGISRLQQLRQLPLQTIFNTILGWERQQRLERLAPLSITVPSGSRIRIDYLQGDSPVLAVRLQEMFGQLSSPTICGGRLPLLIHLLSPARRPIQITSDLAGFWTGSYQEVKKELKGRYPKHYWPDEPLKAPPTRGVKPKNKSRQDRP
ncbi:ATP-dependent helicase HrpB [Desulfogranum mediterraneum]|uniref:ATP-dependent helicase HrpB n=1 Tax=Desulfogranum mediterraneum TaxID=160661 RepID=UPI00040C3742|nr:ATP-dependent helicase HrpB [Desulfogranum mediterraneum]